MRTIAPALVHYDELDATVDEELGPSSGRLDPFGLDDIWRRLVAGHLVLVGAEAADDRVGIIVEHRDIRRSARSMDVKVLERVFRGEPQKLLALELRVSVATITRMCMTVLRKLGVADPSVASAPVVLVMAAHAAHGMRLGAATTEIVPTGAGPTRWRIAAPNPAVALRRQLSPSEYVVANLAVQGVSDVGIATLRRTSPRTTANQVAAAFRKLRVQRRTELRAVAVCALGRQLEEGGSGTFAHGALAH